MFYGLWYEFYKDGTVKVGIIPRKVKARPEHKQKILKNCAAFEMWFCGEQVAKETKEKITQSVGCLGDMLTFWAGFMAGQYAA